MNITGSFRFQGADVGAVGNLSGAFTGSDYSKYIYTTYTGVQYSFPKVISFNASNSGAWTGATSSVGSGTAFSILPPFQRVNIWYRQA